MNIRNARKMAVLVGLCWMIFSANTSAQNITPADTSKNDSSFLDNINFDEANTPDANTRKPAVNTTPAVAPATTPAVTPAAETKVAKSNKKGKKEPKGSAKPQETTPAVITAAPVDTTNASAKPLEGTPASIPSNVNSTASPAVPAETTTAPATSTAPSENTSPAADTTASQTAASSAMQSHNDEAATHEEPISKRSRMRSFVGGSKFNRFSVGLNVGVSKLGNVAGGADYYNNDLVPAVDLIGSYWLGRSMAVQAHIGFPGNFSGSNDIYGANSSYSTSSQFDYSLNLLFNIGNISFLTKKPNIALYTSIGLGGISYNSTTTFADGTKHEGSSRVDNILPIGFGVKYKINEQFTAGVNYTVKMVRLGKLDNLPTNTSDSYSFIGVGVSYTLGKSSKSSLEWSNAAALLYEDINNSDKLVQIRKKVSSLESQLDSIDKKVDAKLDSLSGDDDGDGVPNFLDKQKDTPKGAMVDAAGRALDSDGDGVIDLYDKCPFEKGLPQYEGCKKAPAPGAKGITAAPSKAAPARAETHPSEEGDVTPSKHKPSYKSGEEDEFLKEINDQLLFDKNSMALRPAAQIALDRLANEIKDNNKKLLLTGYTDSDGSEDLNKKLSLQRALVIKKYLVKGGIKGKRLVTRGLGASAPFTPNITSKDKQRNRSVLITYTE